MSGEKGEFNFEKLDVYREARGLAVDIVRATREFPTADRVALGGQLQRASISVASNLAEGSSRLTSRDQAHFTNLAYSSLMEVVCQLDFARELSLIPPQQASEFRQRAWGLARGLSVLHGTQKQRPEGRP